MISFIINMENTIDIKIIEQTTKYIIKENNGKRWMEIPNYADEIETEEFYEYNYQDIIKKIGIPFIKKYSGKNIRPDYVSDEMINMYIQNQKFIEDNDVYTSYDGEYFDTAFKISKIATIVNAIQNNEYKYHLYCPRWYVNYYDEEGEDYRLPEGQQFDETKVPKIEFETNEGLCCIRAFIFCEKNIFAQPIYAY
jgi:hypothetical protein